MNSCKKAFLPFPAVNNFIAPNSVFQKDLVWFLADWGEDCWGMFIVTSEENSFFTGKTPKPSDKQVCFHQSLCSSCWECAVLPEAIKQCIKQPYLDWEVWKLECRTGSVRAAKVSVWDFPSGWTELIYVPGLVKWQRAGTAQGWHCLGARRGCCQVLDPGSCRREMSLSSWLLNLRETYHS